MVDKAGRSAKKRGVGGSPSNSSSVSLRKSSGADGSRGSRRARQRRGKQQAGWVASCLVWMLVFGVFSLGSLQLFLLGRWLGLWNGGSGSSRGSSADPLLDAARNVKSTEVRDDDSETLVATDLESGAGDDTGDKGSPGFAPRHTDLPLHQVIAQLSERDDDFNEMSKPFYTTVPDEKVRQWFRSLDFDERHGEQGPEPVEADVGDLSALVKNSIAQLHRERRAFENEVQDGSLIKLVSEIVDGVSDESESEGPSTPSGARKAPSSRNNVGNSLQDSSSCYEWAALRAANKKDSESVASNVSFSIAGSVPSAHAIIWRQALSKILNLEEISSGSTESDSSTVIKHERVLVLPWTFEASLMTIQGSAVPKSSKTKAYISRLLDPGFTLWPLVARREIQAQGLALALEQSRPTCTLETLGVRPPSFNMGDTAQCQDMFRRFSDQQEALVPWLVKQPAQVVCPQPEPESRKDSVQQACHEVPSDPLVVRGVAGLRRQFGHCVVGGGAGGVPVVLERSVVFPLLIHSRRVKLHALVLVASGHSPWLSYIHPGFITLAAPSARTMSDDDLDPNSIAAKSRAAAGAAPMDTQTLRAESTDIRRQVLQQQLQGGQSPGIWSYARLQRYLESFDLCVESKCDMLWERVTKIARLVVESSMAKQRQQRLNEQLKEPNSATVRGFQVFRIEFWIDERLNPILDRGTSDLGFLLDELAQEGVPGLRDSMAGLLAEAVQISVGAENDPKLWSILWDQFNETCVDKKPVFDACRDIAKVALFAAERSKKQERPKEQDKPGRNHMPQEKEHSSLKKDNSVASHASPALGGMRIAGENEPRFSPKSDLPKTRRNAHVPIDQM